MSVTGLSVDCCRKIFHIVSLYMLFFDKIVTGWAAFRFDLKTDGLEVRIIVATIKMLTVQRGKLG